MALPPSCRGSPTPACAFNPQADRRYQRRVESGPEIEIARRKAAEAELRKALSEVKTLQGLIPICAGCKKVRDDKGYWERIESYLGRHSDLRISHGLCPECARKYYPDLDKDAKTR